MHFPLPVDVPTQLQPFAELFVVRQQRLAAVVVEDPRRRRHVPLCACAQQAVLVRATERAEAFDQRTFVRPLPLVAVQQPIQGSTVHP